MNKEKKLSTTDIAYIGLFAALIAICSWITIPTPMVPITLQTFAVFLTVGILKTKRALLAVGTYILIGAVGVPVFAGFSGGLGSLLGTSGGYIIGFLFTVLVTGIIINKFGNKIYVMFLAMLAGLIVCYIFGTIWFMVVFTSTKGTVSIMNALMWCVFPFIIPDIIKIALACIITQRVQKHIKQ